MGGGGGGGGAQVWRGLTGAPRYLPTVLYIRRERGKVPTSVTCAPPGGEVSSSSPPPYHARGNNTTDN